MTPGANTISSHIFAFPIFPRHVLVAVVDLTEQNLVAAEGSPNEWRNDQLPFFLTLQEFSRRQQHVHPSFCSAPDPIRLLCR